MSKRSKSHKMGRPTKLTPRVQGEIFYLARRGKTDKEIAEAVGVHPATIINWKKTGNFLELLNSAKAIADDMIERSLFERAQGYELHEEVVTGNGETITVQRRLPPDPTSCIFWLKNRRRLIWRDRTEVDGTLNVQGRFLYDVLRRSATAEPAIDLVPSNGNGNGHDDGNGNGHARA